MAKKPAERRSRRTIRRWSAAAASGRQGLEGVVAKRLDSTYQPGRRSRSWIRTAILHAHQVTFAGYPAFVRR